MDLSVGVGMLYKNHKYHTKGSLIVSDVRHWWSLY